MPRRVRAKSDAQWGLSESDLFQHMLWMLLQWSHAKKGLLNGQCGGGGTNTATNNSVIIQIRVQDGLEKKTPHEPIPLCGLFFPVCMAIFGLTVTDLNYFAS